MNAGAPYFFSSTLLSRMTRTFAARPFASTRACAISVLVKAVRLNVDGLARGIDGGRAATFGRKPNGDPVVSRGGSCCALGLAAFSVRVKHRATAVARMARRVMRRI